MSREPRAFEGDGQVAEEAIRRYHAFLEDPTSIRDEEKIVELQARANGSGDVVERLRLHARLDEETNGIGLLVREAFVAVAKSWADENGVGVEYFEAEGFPRPDLRAAGFTVRRGPLSAGGGGSEPKPRSGLRSRVDLDGVARIMNEGGNYHVVMDRFDVVQSTAHHWIKKARENGLIEERKP